MDKISPSLPHRVLQALLSQGVVEFCVCPGARNATFVYLLARASHIQLYYWPEERSAAFFALGRMKATHRPVAVVTTSGTAVAELLPATMEAYYTGLPLVLLTADRPRRFRGTGAPQAAEQVGIFSCYAPTQDLEGEETCDLTSWQRQGPLHLNICCEEPDDRVCQTMQLEAYPAFDQERVKRDFKPDTRYLAFIESVRYPFVIVGALPPWAQAAAVDFLLHLKAPVYLEGSSGIREHPQLEPLRITCLEKLRIRASQHGYPIDGILRLGGIPTARLWRDLEQLDGQLSICSISEQPFAGLSWAECVSTSLPAFFRWGQRVKSALPYDYANWKAADRTAWQAFCRLIKEEPLAETSLVHALSCKIPKKAKVYLGNSLPIREWDQAATYEPRDFQMACNRGLNGIDGQIATFLGYSSAEQENWALLGDLTILYDLVAPWITDQLAASSVNIVVINNYGAGIFDRMFAHPAFQNRHALDFEPFAKLWKWRYERWKEVPACLSPSQGGRFIELLPNPQATERFLHKLKQLF